MSGGALCEKENLNCSNEFGKEAEVVPTCAVLKPSQKGNVVRQLTQKKAPKVSLVVLLCV